MALEANPKVLTKASGCYDLYNQTPFVKIKNYMDHMVDQERQEFIDKRLRLPSHLMILEIFAQTGNKNIR